MDKLIVTIIGGLGGTCHFFLLWRLLKPLSEGKTPRVGLLMLLKLPIPLAFLIGCAIVNVNLLPLGGGAFCLSLFIATIINNFRLKKRE